MSHFDEYRNFNKLAVGATNTHVFTLSWPTRKSASPLPESAQEKQPGGEAAGDLLQGHHREHPGVLHHSVVRRVLSSRQESCRGSSAQPRRSLVALCPAWRTWPALATSAELVTSSRTLLTTLTTCLTCCPRAGATGHTKPGQTDSGIASFLELLLQSTRTKADDLPHWTYILIILITCNNGL